MKHSLNAAERQIVPDIYWLGEQQFLLLEARNSVQLWATCDCESSEPFAFVKTNAADPSRKPRRHPRSLRRGQPVVQVIKLVDDVAARALFKAVKAAIDAADPNMDLNSKAVLLTALCPALFDAWVQCRRPTTQLGALPYRVPRQLEPSEMLNQALRRVVRDGQELPR